MENVQKVRLKLPATGRGPDALVEVGGHDLTRGVSGVTVRSAAGEGTTLEVSFPIAEVEVEGEAVVRMRPETHDALVKLGWTPPTGEE